MQYPSVVLSLWGRRAGNVHRLSLRKLRIKMNALSGAELPTRLLTRPHFSVVVLSLNRSAQCNYPSTLDTLRLDGAVSGAAPSPHSPVTASAPPSHPVHSANNVNKNRANSMQQPHTLLSHRSAAIAKVFLFTRFVSIYILCSYKRSRNIVDLHSIFWQSRKKLWTGRG